VRGSRGIAAATVMALACAVLAATSGGCAARGPDGASGPAVSTSSTAPVATGPVGSVECAPTAPNGQSPPGEPSSSLYHGNGALWTALWPDGTIVFEPGGAGEMRSDGSLAMKFPFWRGDSARGRLTVEGRSLHRPGLTMTGEVPDGYGDAGFQATALVFPEPGCWEVTARSGGATLTFVTKVVLLK